MEKKYVSQEEEKFRRIIWRQNHEYIEEHNSNVNTSFVLGHNQYSDMTHDEFKRYFSLGEYQARDRIPYPSSPFEPTKLRKRNVAETMRNRRLQKDGLAETAMSVIEEGYDHILEYLNLKSENDDNDTLPQSVDWVKDGAVTPVKNQGQCGSCWAFSAVGSIEGALFQKNGELVSLSEQHLVDCDKQDMGCNGGIMDNAFAFEEYEGGLCSEEDYPYAGRQTECQDQSCEDVPGSRIASFVDVEQKSTAALMEALSQQPVSVAIDAGGLAFQFYKSGVFDFRCGSNLDHGVLAVGYGTEIDEDVPDDDGKDYWLVKNSWGPDWGDAGYIKLARSEGDSMEMKGGKCGVLLMPSRPILD